MVGPKGGHRTVPPPKYATGDMHSNERFLVLQMKRFNSVYSTYVVGLSAKYRYCRNGKTATADRDSESGWDDDRSKRQRVRTYKNDECSWDTGMYH